MLTANQRESPLIRTPYPIAKKSRQEAFGLISGTLKSEMGQRYGFKSEA
jgi:hypothetical protein